MKTTLKYLSMFILIFSGSISFAQNAHFIKEGVIEFEKRSNMHAIIKNRIGKDEDSWAIQAFDQYKKNNPQFKVSKSTLSFTENNGLYRFAESQDPVSNTWIDKDKLVDLKNIIATNFQTQSSITQKNVYESVYLVKDSVRKINWKITDETREIAGFECRRANAVIMDSVYVVAFYSNDIAVSGGPESFTGLPGMILGLALPHENMTWFATKVTETKVAEKDLAPPTKGKPVDNKQLKTILMAAMKDWGQYAQPELKAFSL